MAIEFAAAVSTFVTSSLTPVVASDLHARHHLGLLLGGGALGMFVGLCVAAPVIARLGRRRTMPVALTCWSVGLAITVTAGSAAQFATGRALGGFGSGLLAVFGLATVIERLDTRLRSLVMAANSLMWIVPATVMPAVTLLVEHLAGWRVALLLPAPFLLLGRVLVGAATTAGQAPRRMPARALLLPAGALAIAVEAAHLVVLLPAATAVLVGTLALLPTGASRVARGAPAAILTLLLFAAGFYGADALVTVLFTGAFGTPLAAAGVALSAGALGWSLTTLALTRFARTGSGPAPLVPYGLAGTAACVGGLAALIAAPVYAVAIALWTTAGCGVGLAYPGLFLRATTVDDRFDAVTLAAAAVSAESVGGLLGQTLGGAIAVSRPGTAAAYAVFAVLLAVAAGASTRAGIK